MYKTGLLCILINTNEKLEDNMFDKKAAPFNPRYKHDCGNCIFLGQYAIADLYACINKELFLLAAAQGFVACYPPNSAYTPKIGCTGYLEGVVGNHYGKDETYRSFFAANVKITKIENKIGDPSLEDQLNVVQSVVIFQRYPESSHPLTTGGGGRNLAQGALIRNSVIQPEDLKVLTELLTNGVVKIQWQWFERSAELTIELVK